jgi:isoquinoline 1-oxidoreductase beta subunit
MAVAEVLGLKPERVTFHTEMAGGGFGRRAVPDSHVQREAASIAKRFKGTPVKLVWSREDDIRGGYYRPMHVHRVEIGVGGDGLPNSWRHVVVGQSLLEGTPFAMMMKDGVDSSTVEGVNDTHYHVPNFSVSVHHPKVNVPVLWWRSVGNTHTAFVKETMIDEMAKLAAKDPLEYRRGLLAKAPRSLAALNLAAEKAGWGTPLPAGRARGIAVHESFGSAVAEVAECSIVDGKIKVHKVTAAIDCGTAVNPGGVAAQVEGAIIFGLSAALSGAITFKDGVVEQSNFHDYAPLRINEVPVVDVHIVASTAAPTGVGEPATPVIAPAVANAVAALNGKRLRSLPFKV